MPRVERNGKRKTRDQLSKQRIPELGYYFIVTDTKETEQNYMLGLRDSIPEHLQGKLVIKVIKKKTKDLVEEARDLASLHPQYGEPWIVFDRDQVKDFDEIIVRTSKNDTGRLIGKDGKMINALKTLITGYKAKEPTSYRITVKALDE